MAKLRLVAIAVVFAVWWAISACNQFRSGAWTFRFRRHIPLGLIPLWTFFAPNPARADSRLVWREEHAGKWSGWRELHFGYAPITRRWLVNPELILNKAVTDLVSSLLRVSADPEDRSTVLSSAYVSLLQVAHDQPRPAGSFAVQFAIVRTSTDSTARRLNVVFLSEVHAAEQLTHVC